MGIPLTLPETSPELNPLRIEHRLTIVEQSVITMTEQAGNLMRLIERQSRKVADNEAAITAEADLRRRELMIVQDSVDALSQGIKDRQSMEMARAEGFLAGQHSITVKLPVKQISAIIASLLALMSGVQLAINWFS